MRLPCRSFFSIHTTAVKQKKYNCSIKGTHLWYERRSYVKQNLKQQENSKPSYKRFSFQAVKVNKHPSTLFRQGNIFSAF